MFEIPLRQKVRHTSLKYATLTSLISQRGEIIDELSGLEELFEDPDKTIKITMREISSINDKKKKAEDGLSNAKVEMNKSKSNISKQEGMINGQSLILVSLKTI